MPKMTDTEIVCCLMEPRSALPACWSGGRLSPKGWWIAASINSDGVQWSPVELDLGRLHEVEAKLRDWEWKEYEFTLNARCNDRQFNPGKAHWWAIHADAETRTISLAAVLRPEVEVRDSYGRTCCLPRQDSASFPIRQ